MFNLAPRAAFSTLDKCVSDSFINVLREALAYINGRSILLNGDRRFMSKRSDIPCINFCLQMRVKGTNL